MFLSFPKAINELLEQPDKLLLRKVKITCEEQAIIVLNVTLSIKAGT